MEIKRMIREKYAWVIPGTVVLILTGIILILLLPYGNQTKTEVQPLDFVGTYTMPGGEAVPLDGNPITILESNEIEFKGNFDRPLTKGDQVFFLIKYLEVHISFNGTEIYSYGTEEQRPYVSRSGGMSWNHIVVPEDTSQEAQWTITLKNRYPNNYYHAYGDFIDSFQTGDSGALGRLVGELNWPYILGSTVFLFVSLVMLLLVLVIRMQKIKIHNSVYLFCCFSMSFCIWCLLNPVVSTLMLDNPIMIMNIEMIMLINSSILFKAYLGSMMQTKARRVNRCIVFLLTIAYVVYLIMVLIGRTDAYACRTIMMIILALSDLICLVELIYEIWNTKERRSCFLMVIGILTVLLVTAEIVNYELEFSEPRQYLFIGFFVIMIVQFGGSVRYIRNALVRAQYAAEMESELTQSRISIMLSQIQPHFLYNSLTAISELCIVEPQSARRALIDFSVYLRGNMDSLQQDQPIPFKKELDHIKTYLSLEKMRFGDELNIVFDIQTTAFEVPSLTVQPLVENAVRYGVGNKDGGGTVTISSWEEREAYVVCVSDDGVGFDLYQTKFDGRTHIGIENVERRVESMCGGRIKIESTINVGTTALIKIPKEDL